MHEGDIALERGGGLGAAVTAGLTGGRYSHALIWIGGGDFIEAMPTGIRVLQAMRVPISNRDNWMLLRLRGDRKNVAAQAAKRARTMSFKEYDLEGALRSPVAPRKGEKATALFCSQLIASAYAATGIELLPGKAPSSITPNDLAKSAELEEINIPTTPPPPIAMNFFKHSGLDRSALYESSMLAKERDINVELFKNASALFEGIRWPQRRIPGSFGELQDILSYIDRANADKIADQLLLDMRRSGYLELILGPMQEIISNRMVAGQSERIPSYEFARQRNLENAKACQAAHDRHSHPLWSELQNMYLRNQAGFAVLIEIAAEQNA